MQGKHLFLRCKDAQNNAGTWTAAMTAGILTQNEVRDLIEPRCNVNESFAQACMSNNNANSILRIYHPKQDLTVITRTTWTTDRLTEAFGRKGAYSVSCVLTDSDSEHFGEQFEGAFDPAFFESYDSLLERAHANGGKVTIGLARDIFSYPKSRCASGVFKKIGLTAETFSYIMEGVYAAIHQNSHFVVIIPRLFQAAWEQEGDNTAEQLARAIMECLPPHTRNLFGFASHWGSNLDDRMIDGMHLVFVQNSLSEAFNKIRTNSVGVVDIESGKQFGLDHAEAPSYFRFLWEQISNYDQIERFWAYGEENYAKLLHNMPDSATAMECVYLLSRYESQQEYSQDLERSVFLSAAKLFAGAGTAVPYIEKFFHKIMVKMLEQPKLDSDSEQAVLAIMTNDRRPTSHQTDEYRLLIRQILSGNAKSESLEALSAEMLRESRNADVPLVQALGEICPTENWIEKEQLFELLLALLKQISPERNAHEELHVAILDIVEQTVDIVVHDRDYVDPETLYSLIDCYLKYDASRQKLTQICYEILFADEQNCKGTQKNSTREILKNEERRLYDPKIIQSDSLRVETFANCFFEKSPFIKCVGPIDAEALYPRMYRLMCADNDRIRKQATEHYQDELTAVGQFRDSNYLSRTFFPCQLNAMKEIANAKSLWSQETLRKAVLQIERCNLSVIRGYYPQVGGARFNFILQVLKDHRTLPILLYLYLRNMNLSEQRAFYETYGSEVRVVDIYAQVIIRGDDRIASVIRQYLPEDGSAIVRSLVSADIPSDSDRQKAISVFAQWYYSDIKSRMNALQRDGQSNVAILMQLGKELGLLQSCQNERREQPLLDVAMSELINVIKERAQRMDGSEFAFQPNDTLEAAEKICKSIPKESALGLLQGLALIRSVDECHDYKQLAAREQLKPFVAVTHKLGNLYRKYYRQPGDQVIMARLQWWANRNKQHGETKLFRTDALVYTALRNRDPSFMMAEYCQIDYDYPGLPVEQKAITILDHLCAAAYNNSLLFQHIVGPLEKEFDSLGSEDPTVFSKPVFQTDYFPRLSARPYFRNLLSSRGFGNNERTVYNGNGYYENGMPQNGYKQDDAVVFLNYGKLCLICLPICCVLSLLLLVLFSFLSSKVSIWVAVVAGILLLALGVTAVFLELRGLKSQRNNHGGYKHETM